MKIKLRQNIMFIAVIAILLSLIVIGPSIIQGSGGFYSGVWTGYEKERIIRLLEEIAENTGSCE